MARRLTIFGLAGARPLRRAALVGLVLAVLLAHGCVTQTVADRIGDFNAAAAMPARIEVAYVREMTLAAPPTLAPSPPVPAATPQAPRAPKPKPVAEPASAPEPAASEPELAASAPEAVVTAAATEAAASEPESQTSASASSAASASDSQSDVQWPASTRVSYLLTGNYRGAVEGHAQVEWARVGSHYQVHLDLAVGPSFAPLITRRTTSDGEITADGLVPHRYDEDTQVMFRDRRRLAIVFEPDAVLLPNGQRVPKPAGVQDAASQFVQLTYLFTARPELLRAGQTMAMPLALARRVSEWTYDVIGEETIYTSFGPLPAVHLKPRLGSNRPGDLTAEIWFAPQLRYLPARIRIQQDEQTYIDLMIERKPEMAAP